MLVPMMNVRVVSMAVTQRRVAVGMAVRFPERVVGAMLVLVMFVVAVAVFMDCRFVCVFMLMMLGQV